MRRLSSKAPDIRLPRLSQACPNLSKPRESLGFAGAAANPLGMAARGRSGGGGMQVGEAADRRPFVAQAG
jgi:hypothetical protein